jgi:DNA gyrase subunit B
VGVSCVNALSEWLEAEIGRDGNVYHQRFEKAKPVSKLTKIGKTRHTGTQISFLPDPTIFSVCEFDWETLSNRLRELAFLNGGVRIDLAQEDPQRQETFRYKGGLE